MLFFLTKIVSTINYLLYYNIIIRNYVILLEFYLLLVHNIYVYT